MANKRKSTNSSAINPFTNSSLPRTSSLCRDIASRLDQAQENASSQEGKASRSTLYKEDIGYQSPATHRDMERYLDKLAFERTPSVRAHDEVFERVEKFLPQSLTVSELRVPAAIPILTGTSHSKSSQQI